MKNLIWTLVLPLPFLFSCSSEPKPLGPVQTDFCSQIHRNDTLELSDVVAPFAEKMKSQTGVFVLEDGNSAMVTRAWLSEYAEESIDIQYFIFELDNVGIIACDYILRAAERGVKIRILIDDVMVHADLKHLLTLDYHENITIKIYNPGVNLGKNILGTAKKFATDFKDANQRMHNKTFIVDGTVVITGGRNIADEYFDYDHGYNFRDRDVLLIGKETQAVSNSFDTFWNSEISQFVSDFKDPNEELVIDPNLYDWLHEYACNPENFWPQIREQIDSLPSTFTRIANSGGLVWSDSVEFISDLPGKNDEEGFRGGGITETKLVELVESAQHSIDIQTPYLITTEMSRAIFKAAVDRGVQIRILTNSLASTDNVEAFSGYQATREELLATGVRIFEFRPDAKERMDIMTGQLHSETPHVPVFGLHAKSMVIDGKTTVIGTYNLDPRSANLNTECFVIIHSKAITEKVQKGMEIEFEPENSWETTMEFNPDTAVSITKRVKTWSRQIIPDKIL